MNERPFLATNKAVKRTTSRSCALILGIRAEKWKSGGAAGPAGFSGSGSGAASPVRPADIAVPRPALTSSSRQR